MFRIVEWILRAIIRFGPRAARWVGRLAFAWWEAELLRRFLAAEEDPEKRKEEFGETLRAARGYPSWARAVFFSLLKDIVIEKASQQVWDAFVAYARQARESDPELAEVADEAVKA